MFACTFDMCIKSLLDLTCSVMFFPVEKLLLNVRLCLSSPHNTLQCWAKFSNVLVH